MSEAGTVSRDLSRHDGHARDPPDLEQIGDPGARRQRARRTRLQQRLASLGYWLGTPDGTLRDSTEHAIQKAAGITRDGIVGGRSRTSAACPVT